MILPQLRAAILACFPGLDAPKKAFFRVVKRNAARLNLQPVDAITDQTKDVSNIEVCPGVPGVTSDPTEGEQVIVMFVGKDEVPYIIGRAALDMPGHLPFSVRHDAVRDIKFVSKTSAKVTVGITTVPVAKAPNLVAYLNALETWALSIDLAIAPAVLLLTAPQQLAYAASVTARTTAAGNISTIASTRLEAE